MNYDFLDVTEIRHDKEKRRLEVVSGEKTTVVEGVDTLILKSVPFIDERGTVYLNRGRVSIAGNEAAAGD